MLKQRWKAILLLTGIGVIAVFCWLLYMGERPLLERATPVVAGTERWIQEYGGYFWASDQEILSFREVGRGNVHAYRVDIVTGAARPLMTLNTLLRGSARDTAFWRLSPDGKWLVWLNLTPPRPHWVASPLDGSPSVTWPVLGNSQGPLWLPGNQSWVEFSLQGMNTAVPWIHNLDGTVQHGPTINGSLRWPIGVTSTNRVLSVEMPMNAILQNVTYSLTSPPTPAQTYQVALPGSTGTAIETELSPQGDRVAYLLHSERQSPVQQFLHWLIPSADSPSIARYSIWVSRVDGSQTHRIGDEEGHAVTALLWTPDGKHLSFFCNNTLYTVPAD
jgi:hypothetical protein